MGFVVTLANPTVLSAVNPASAMFPKQLMDRSALGLLVPAALAGATTCHRVQALNAVDARFYYLPP